MYPIDIDVVPVRNGALFGQSLVPIILDDVICDGDESRLLECSHNVIGQHNCNRTTDTAGVICGGNNAGI